MIEKVNLMNQLLDQYAQLLTENQRNVAMDYYQEDYSLAEIAENNGVSKNAIYDGLKRTETILLDYEAKLGLVKKSQKLEMLFNQLLECNHNDVNTLVKQYQEENNE